MYQPISYLKDLKDCFTQLKLEFNATRDPYPSQDLLQTVLKLLSFALSDLKQTVSSSPDTKKFFFEELIPGLTKRLVLLKGDANSKHYPLIEQIVFTLTQIFVSEIDSDNSDMADSMRCLFNYNSELHQSTLTSSYQPYELSLDDPQTIAMLDADERKWRDELKEGSLIDAVKIESDNYMRSWSKAVVVRETRLGSAVEVDFVNETSRLTREINKYSGEISKEGTKSLVDEWKNEVNIGDLVDACDLTKVWYSSTVVDKEIRTYYDREVLFFKIGFRIYEPNGTKIDQNMRRFFGWSESFDEWLPAFNPRIQKFKSLPDIWEQTISITKIDDNFDDSMDNLLYQKKENQPLIYAVPRRKCHSKLLVDMLNLFGEKGGFDLILNKIKNSQKTGLDLVFYYLDCLANSYIMYNNHFYVQYVEELIEAVNIKILNSSEQMIRNVKKDRIDGILHSLISVLQQRQKNKKTRDYTMGLWQIQIGCVFLEQNLLEKRIDGVKYILDVCRSANLSTFQSGNETLMNNTAKQHSINLISEIVKVLKDKNVLYQIFSRERSHVQLVQRSEEILKLLLSQDLLTDDELSLIWSCTKIDEEIQLELYKLFNEISNKFRPQDLAFIIEKLQQKSSAQKEEIELIHELAKRSKSADYQYSQLAADKIDKSLVNQAALCFSDIIKYWPIEHKNKEGFLTIKMLSRMFKDFIGTYTVKVEPETAVEDTNDKSEEQREEQKKVEEDSKTDNLQQTPQSFESKTHFINYIAEKYDLFQVLQQNFNSYMLRSRQIVLKKIEENSETETSGLGDKCICDRFIHSDQITERLEFLKYCAQNGTNLQISEKFLESLWDQLVKGSLIQSDAELFYRWMREICEQCSQGFFLVDVQVLLQFYRERIASSPILKFITLEGFNCIQTFFVLINESQRKVLKLNQQSFYSNVVPSNENVRQKKSQYTSFNSNTGGAVQNFSFNNNSGYAQIGPTPPPLLNLQSANQHQSFQSVDPEDLELHTLVHPDTLEGIEGMWMIAFETSDTKVHERVNQFLVKLYTTVSYKFEDQLSDFEDAFISKCMDKINEQIVLIEKRKDIPKDEFVKVERPILQFTTIGNTILQKLLPPEERKITKCISLMKDLMRNSEKEGTNGIRPHSALMKGEYLDTIQVSNSLRNGAKFSAKIEIGCYSNLTLWDFRKVVAQRIALTKTNDGHVVQETPTHPALVRLYRYTGSTDLKEFENGMTLADLRFKNNENLTVFKKNSFSSIKIPLLDETGTRICDKAYSIFQSWFDLYSEEDPDNPGRKIMTPKTCVDFTRSCTEDPCDEDDNRVVSLFALYDRDHDNKIQEEDFMDFFLNSCREKEDIVRQNLMMHQIKNDLTKVLRDDDPENILQPRKSVLDMPRYKIANNPDHYETLFKLLDSENELSNYTWTFIKQIATNPNLYWRILYLDKNPEFKWEWIFDSTNIYKMLYSLQIIESLLEENPNLIGNFSLEDTLKKDWTKRFLQINGFQQILSLFHKALDILSAKHADQLVKFEKYFLEYMLKLIKIFMMSAFKASSGLQNAFDALLIVRKGSSYKESDNPPKADDFKTPSKQIKGKFIKTTKVHPAKLGFEIVPEQMTEEYLFDDTQDAQDMNENQNKSDQQKQKSEEQKESKQEQQNVQDETDDMSRFSELTSIMQQSGLGEEILEKINFEELQGQILELVCIIMAKKEIGLDDINILEKAISLWVASLIRNENLFDKFYLFERSEEKAGKYGIRNCEDFVLQGIYTYKSTRNQGKIPLFYVLNLLKQNFPKEDNFYATRECKQYFDLMVKLIDEYFQLVQSKEYEGEKFDVFGLLTEAISKFKKYESKEKKASPLEDKNLIGYLNLITKLIQALTLLDRPSLSKLLEDNDFLNELFYEDLFHDQTHSRSENKCKTKESRAAAFFCLQACMQTFEPKELSEFLEYYIWPLVSKVNKPKKWCYTPSENSRAYQYVGIVNLGCICYMNSMLQQFFMIPAFRYQLLKAADESPSNIVEYRGLKIEDNLLKQLQKLFGYLEISDRQAYDPTEFCFSFKDFDGNPTNTALQQDVQEFLSIFFDRLENLLKPTSQRHLLQSIFGGKVCSQLICPNCGIVRNILESFYNLSLVVKDRKGMEDSLYKMIEGSVINDFKCDKCNEKVDVVKRSLIAETPNVLIIHLQRIVFNFDSFQNDKINSRFDFPTILKLKNYSVREVMTGEGKKEEIEKSEELKHLMEICDEEYTYRLVGVTVHIGTAEQGHYYSLINCKRGSEEPDENKAEWMTPEKDMWKIFEDEKVKYYSFSDLKQDSFGGNNQASMNDNDINAYLTSNGGSFGKNAYMLVYERQKKLPLLDYAPFESSLACADTAVSREDPVSVQVDFKKVDPFVPDWIKSIVLQDNQYFTLDKQIFNDNFFNLIKSIFKYISDKILLSQHRYQLDYMPNFYKLKRNGLKVAKKVMFEQLAYFFHNIQMSDINSSFGSLIMFCDSSYSLERGDPSLLCEFIEETYLKDNCLEFFNIMFNCTDKTSRFYIGKMTTQVINKAFAICKDSKNKQSERIKELQAAAEKFMYITVNVLMTSDCQKNWMRLENFLKLINEIGMGGELQIEFMLTQFDIITKLIDFMLGNQSPLAKERRPNMGAGMTNPPFEPLISLLCNLIRYSLTPSMKQEELLWNDSDRSPPSTLLGYSLYRDQGNPEKYPLTSSGELMFFTQEFIDKIFKDGYECEEFGKALAHFCYKNEKVSKRVAKTLLKGISKNDFERIKNYLDVVTQVVFLKDDLQRMRLEWIFGFGTLNSSSIYNQSLQEDKSHVFHTRVGIQIISNLTDEPFQFKSSLLNDTSDDALLHMLWRYKGRIDQYTVNCLNQLVSIISADRDISEYFSTLPGPTYCYARYTDWIRPYLNEQLLDARKGYSGSLSQGKEEVIIKTLSMYEIYEKYLKEKDGVLQESDNSSKQIELVEEEKKDEGKYGNQIERDDEENVRKLIEFEKNQEKDGPKIIHFDNEETYNAQKIIVCQPQPYIIIDCMDSKVIQEVKDPQNEDVSLILSSLSCSYTWSNPTGNNNISIPPNVLRRGYVYQKRASKDKANREQELQTFSINSHFESKNIGKQVVSDISLDQTLEKKKKSKNVRIQQYDDENNRMQLSDFENDSNEETQDQDHYFSQPKDDSHTYQIKVVESDSQATNNIEEVQQIVMQDSNMEDKSIQNQNQDEDEIIWPYQVSVCNDLIYKFHVTNEGSDMVKYSLSLTSQYGDDINLVWPRSQMKGNLYGNSSKTVILMPKVIPLERNENDEPEVFKLNINFKSKMMHNMNNQGNNSHRRNGVNNDDDSSNIVPKLDFENGGMVSSIAIAAGDDNGVVYSTEGKVFSEPIGVDVTSYEPGFSTGGVVSEGGFKECPQCTLNNPSSYAMCEACEFVF